MSKLIQSSTRPFTISVPYQLYEAGPEGKKPLFVYLHGYGQNSDRFRALFPSLSEQPGYHLFIRAPYPIYSRRRAIPDWGAAWYLYDGDQERFVASLEEASGFVESVVKEASEERPVSATILLGYSMGGYLAGYMAYNRRQLLDHLVVIGARIKTELFADWERLEGLSVLALHGEKDDSVKADPQREAVQEMRDHGIDAEFRTVASDHDISPEIEAEIIDWLREHQIVAH